MSTIKTMVDLSDKGDRIGFVANSDPQTWQRVGLAMLLSAYTVICCVSLRSAYPYYHDSYILFDASRLQYAVAAVAAFALVSSLFVFARFSFGYFAGFYFYTMILGYLWLNSFSLFQYDHKAAGVSAAISAVAFLLPALLITSPIKQLYVLPERAFERLLTLILLFSAATAVVGASYNFKLIAIEDIYEFRDQLQIPTLVNYAIGATTSVLLPFAFAGFLALKKPWQAGAILLIALSFYPITLSKTTLFAPFSLVALAAFLKITDAKVTAILSLLLPILAGLIMILAIGEPTRQYFNNINVRMIMVPSSAMDIYNEYFARHELTHFCQISILKLFVSCALEHPLAVEMQNNYALGNFNASLFATEGIASVGLFFAPVATFVCGLVFALGNRLSAGLPPRFIMISGAVLPQILLNVPLTITLITHGAALLFLLWYVTPRTMFKHEEGAPTFLCI
jgi:hypothetical protein